MVRDLVHNLCESLVENIDGVAGVGKKTPPTPITYLTQWKIVGNSEVHGSEIWSCGEYNATDGKYHILVQPQGGSIADIALDEPLRMIDNIAADKIEFANNIATVTRYLKSVDAGDWGYSSSKLANQDKYRMIKNVDDVKEGSAVLCASYPNNNNAYTGNSNAVSFGNGKTLSFYDADYDQQDSAIAFKAHVAGIELIYELATPTTELVDAPQIEEADSYTCEISQGGKAVEWSSFETE